MSKRFQNVNKYRNALWYADIPVGTSSSDSSALVQANKSWIALNWSGGGTLGLLPLSQPGKGCAAQARVFQAHGARLSNWHFSPFHDNVLATGGEDSLVKVWKIPEYNDTVTDPICTTTLKTPSRRVDMVRFHPTADQILTTLGNDGKKVISANAFILLEIDASLLATCGKDTVQVWDPRLEENLVQTGPGHEEFKGSRVVWLNNSNYIFTVGMNKMRSREYGIWDSRNLSKPYMMKLLDTSTGTLLPLYDDDTETMYLISRGDASIRSLQLSDVSSSNPTVSDNFTCGTNASLLGATLLPKQSLDVMHTEVARLLTVSSNAVIPVSYQVPRKQYIDFHGDLFPDTKGSEPALSSAEWFAGNTCQVATVSLDPSKKQLPPSTFVAKSQDSTNDIAPVKNTHTLADPIRTGNTTPTEAAPAQKHEKATSAQTAPTQNHGKSTSNDISAAATTGSTASTTSISPSTSTSAAKKVLPKYGATNPSVYKYINNKTYHPSTHYDDLNGLDFNKSGTTELIQANAKFIAIPLSGPGGRIGIISTGSSTGGRLPTRLPCILTGSDVTYFQFDPFDAHVLATASDDNKIRLFRIPENGLEEDLSETMAVLQDPHMDKVSLLAYHPTAKHILATASQDLDTPTLRIWSTTSASATSAYSDIHKDTILAMAWRPDGKAIATVNKEKQLRIVDARTGHVIGQAKSHQGIRPSRLAWLDGQRFLVSVGFGLGSMREILLYDTTSDMTGPPLAKKSIDVSPSIMNVHFDRDCKILYIAGKGDRTIHTYEFENDSTLTPLAKLEFGSLQQGFSFLPKRLCNVKALEIGKFYRLTSTTIEPVGVHVPRARPEFFQDDIFIPTLDIEHSTQDDADWFQGNDKPLETLSLQPSDMTPCK
ncbi:unnamed protein product [Absidia cylindrospora]